MDYHAIHGHDISSFTQSAKSSHAHRLVTVSAARAFEELNSKASRFVSTSLDELDLALVSGAADTHAATTGHGGIRKGQVTEIWGPPATGKTTFGIQLVANTIRGGGNAVWVDALHHVCSQRLVPATEATQEEPAAGRLVHFTCPSLAHFIALLCRPSPSCIPENTGLIIVDALSVLLTDAFPKTRDKDSRNKTAKNTPSGPARKNQVLRYIATALQRLAATHDMAVVVLTQCVTRIERGAALIPAINTGEWDQGISTRMVLFRDWVWHDHRPLGVRFVGVQKVDGKATKETEAITPFEIRENGLVPVKLPGSQQLTASLSSQKRKLDDTDFEVPNSDDDDYGWLEEDDMPAMPPQWQGSEDILLGHRAESDDDSEHEEGVDHNQSSQDGGVPTDDKGSESA